MSDQQTSPKVPDSPEGFQQAGALLQLSSAGYSQILAPADHGYPLALCPSSDGCPLGLHAQGLLIG
jgi:hypothetical protein